MKKVHPRYSGKHSDDFWNAVSKIKNPTDHAVVYSLGVALQTLEDYVLNQLKMAKKK